MTLWQSAYLHLQALAAPITSGSVGIDQRAVRDVLLQQRRERHHVRERHRTAHLAVHVFVIAHRVDDFIGHLPVLEQRLGHVGVPVAHDGLIGERIGEQRRMTCWRASGCRCGRRCASGPRASAVSPLSEEKRRAITCDSAAICTLCFHSASSIGSRCLNCAALSQLLHREAQRRRAHDVESHARDGHAQIGDLAAGRIERGGVRHVQQLAGEHRLGAEHLHHGLVADVFVGQRASAA